MSLRSVLSSFFSPSQIEYLKWKKTHSSVLDAVLEAINIGIRSPRLVVQNFPGGTVSLRLNTPHDKNIFSQVFHEKEYDVDLVPPKTIVDAGAHIGLASAYFATKYPSSKIIAVEPDKNNYSLLCRNTIPFSDRVKPLNAALWDTTGEVSITNPDAANESGFRVGVPTECRVPALSVGDLIDEYTDGFVDILKLDVEGAEARLLKDPSDWISNVGTLIVEVHDRFVPGCLASVQNVAEVHDFDIFQSGENYVLTRRRSTVRTG